LAFAEVSTSSPVEVGRALLFSRTIGTRHRVAAAAGASVGAYPDSTVALFPSDHFVAREKLFMAHVDAAFGVVERDVAKIILVGIPADFSRI